LTRKNRGTHRFPDAKALLSIPIRTVYFPAFNKSLSSQCESTFPDPEALLPAQIPATLASADAIERYTQLSSHPFHKTAKPGILACDISPDKVRLILCMLESSRYVAPLQCSGLVQGFCIQSPQ
jgi:hypothetical protein